MFSAVIFDMDGLMFDTEPIWASCWPTTLEEFGLPYMDGLADAMRGTNGSEAISIIEKWYEDRVDAKALVSRYYEIAHDALRDGAEKKPGLDSLLEYLTAKGTPMAVASSSSPEMIRANLERAGIFDCFSAVVSGLEVQRAKPYPDVFLRAAQLLDALPGETVVLEDSYNGVRAGSAGGFCTVMVPDLSEPTDEMRKLAHSILPSLNEVKERFELGDL